ncbi:50S ribosomal protein L11 methyltransferase, partial [Marinomonas arenicola]
LNTTREHVPAFEDTLVDCGAIVVTFEDVHDDPVYEPDLNTTPLWKHTQVTGLFVADADLEHIRPAVEHKAA